MTTGRVPRARVGALFAAALLAAGCQTTTQTTSGGDFIAARPEWAARFTPSGGTGAAAPPGGIDRAVYEAANAEPLLRFPARIGLARIQHGALTTIPAEEGDAWLELIRTRGQGYGEFVPVSPLVAQLTAAGIGRETVRTPVDMIRVGAARQHLDAVLIYEVGGTPRDTTTPLSVLDLTIIGNFIIPSRLLQGRATAAAMLIDVRNGYPYGTALARGEERGMWFNAGSTDRSHLLVRRAQEEAVHKLTGEVATMIERLRSELAQRELARLRAVEQARPAARRARRGA
jgi:hypothetical protein